MHPLPIVDAGKEERIIAGSLVQLQASGIYHLAWTQDSSLSCCTCYAPMASPLVTTAFYVTAYSKNGFKATDIVVVRVVCNGNQLYVPNTFTLNGDGISDYFFPQGKAIHVIESFRIFSWWGELLYDRKNMAVNDPYAGSNGSHNGQKLNPDVYLYVIIANCGTNEHIMLKRDIALIR